MSRAPCLSSQASSHLQGLRLDPMGTRSVPASQPDGSWLSTTYKVTMATARTRTKGCSPCPLCPTQSLIFYIYNPKAAAWF